MPKKAHLEPHLSDDQLKECYLNSSDRVESRRWHLLWMLSVGWSIKQAAAAIGLNYDYAKECVQKYNRTGASALKNRRKMPKAGGKRSLLDAVGIEKLRQALKSPPADGGLWTGPKVARWIAQETGHEKVWNQRGWDYLKRLNYAPQTPRPKHKKGNEEEQKAFKKKLPTIVTELKKKHPHAQIEVWAFDEHRLGLKPILRKVWAPRGERPRAVVCHRYEWLYLYGYVRPETGETEWHIMPRVNVDWFNKSLDEFAKSVGAGRDKIIVLVVDRAGWHKSERVVIPPGIHVEFLPAYSPELQPAERLWTLADEPLVNKYFETLDELESVLVQRCQTLSTMTEEIQALTNYHWWPSPSAL